MHELDDEHLLAHVLASIKSQLNVADLQKIGSGNEFYVYRADLAAGPVAIKIPKDKTFSNVNDTHIDSNILVEQESVLIRYVQSQGIQEVPAIVTRIDAAGYSVIVMAYLPSDDSKPYEYQLGVLLAHINTMPPPTFPLTAQEGMEIPELLATRLRHRWQELTKFVDDLPALPSSEILTEALGPIRQDKRLLHMDFRQANFRTQQGKVLAVLDWSNALIGPQALELARLAEIGEIGHNGKLAEAFLEGYSTIAVLPMVNPVIETIFRLDTVVMLALVFLSEEPDPIRAPILLQRINMLFRRLNKLLS